MPATPARAVLWGHLVLHVAFLGCSLFVLAQMVTGALPWWWLWAPLVAAPLNGAGCRRVIRQIRAAAH